MMLLTLIVASARAAEPTGIETRRATVRVLAEQARYWSARNRVDIATVNWKRVLQLDPSNAEALLALGRASGPSAQPVGGALAPATGSTPKVLKKKAAGVTVRPVPAKPLASNPAPATQPGGSEPADPATPRDSIGALLAQGFVALDAKDTEGAMMAFEAALESEPSSSDALGGLGIVRMRQSRFGEARELLARADGLATDQRWQAALRDASFWELAAPAGEGLATGDPAAAAEGYARALLIDPGNAFATAQLAEAEAQIERARVAAETPTDSDLAGPVFGESGPQKAAAPSEQAYALAPGFRRREGENGLGRLREWSSALTVPLGGNASGWSLRVSPVRLEAGRLATDAGTRDRFGAGPLLRNATPISSQTEDGVGLSLAWRDANWSADVGTTPVGFRYADVSAGLRVQGSSNGMSYAVQLSRRPVTESLLSFAGTRDPRNGREWGGVMATGGRVEVSRDFGGWGLYAYGGGSLVDGHNVAGNSRLEAGTGAYRQLLDEADARITTGLGISSFGYDRNLGQYTFGHGGYFSPQAFLTVGVPIDWGQRVGALAWRVQAFGGVQRFRAEATPFFPDDPAMQAAAAGLGDASYASSRSTGPGYNLSLVADYALSPQLSVGGYFFTDNATDFRQQGGGFYLRLDPEGRGVPDFRQLQILRMPYPVR
jgi:tetratricopeptide (TPR) repeat protein